MIIRPLGQVKRRQVALLHPEWRSLSVRTEDGLLVAKGLENSRNLLEALEGHALFVSGSLKSLINATGARPWQVEIWRGKATTLVLDGTKVRVHSLRHVLDPLPSDDDRFAALLELSDFLGNLGVGAGSISAMAWGLWRSTIDQEFELSFDAKIGHSGVYGGRQAAVPGHYRNIVAIDIRSAYPFAMANQPYAGKLRPVSASTPIRANEPGLAVARVQVPDHLAHAPLPVRIDRDILSWPTGEVTGTWTWQELAAAEQLGCGMQIIKSWAPLTYVQPFQRWWPTVSKARQSLSPAAGQLIKAISNSLWGMFGMTGDDRSILRWKDDFGHDGISTLRLPRKLPQASAAHIAAETTSRVRTRMLLEGLYGAPGGDSVHPVHIDTDGILVASKDVGRLSRHLGDEPGQWRIKTEMTQVDIKAPQFYRYRCSSSCRQQHDWHYVASGMNRGQAVEAFGKKSQSSGLGFSMPESDT